MEEKDNTYIPKTLDEAYMYLDAYLQDKESFKNYPEEDVVAMGHMYLGRWMRNNWNLWWSKELYERIKNTTPDYPSEKPELVLYFNKLGIYHADDMSGIIIDSYHKKLNGKSYDLGEDVKRIIKFYEDQNGDNDIIQSMKNEQE